MFTTIRDNAKKAKNRCKKRPKSYVILCNSEYMIVPIKADMNPYNGNFWFAGGTPQFFGGSPQGDQLQTMQQEVREESRETLRLDTINGQVYTAEPSDIDNNTYSFSYSLNWDRTGTPWNDDVQEQLPPNQREMQRLVSVQRNIFAGRTDPNEIIGILVNETNTVFAPGSNVFNTSHTATAFVIFIRDIWPNL
ncbi:hypothetical protein [Microcoleus sp. B4-C1]|uniref:hypothetical protein n=1 Tax=Microcoleus sp. B4-C1 TaxID=2818660 RepID=UPI002FD3A566